MHSEISVRRWWYAILALLCANILIYKNVFSPAETGVDVHSTGKSVVTLIRVPGHAPLLLNTGSDASILRVLGTTLLPWERTLSAVILTDAKSTHAGGAPEVFSRYRVDTLVRLGAPGAATREAAIARTARLDAISTTLTPAYGAVLRGPEMNISLVGPDVFVIATKNKTLVVSSTTSVGMYSL